MCYLGSNNIRSTTHDFDGLFSTFYHHDDFLYKWFNVQYRISIHMYMDKTLLAAVSNCIYVSVSQPVNSGLGMFITKPPYSEHAPQL